MLNSPETTPPRQSVMLLLLLLLLVDRTVSNVQGRFGHCEHRPNCQARFDH